MYNMEDNSIDWVITLVVGVVLAIIIYFLL
jgi:phosphate/sulfate permease